MLEILQLMCQSPRAENMSLGGKRFINDIRPSMRRPAFAEARLCAKTVNIPCSRELAPAMPDPSKTVLRVTVSAPKRGKLSLEWQYSDGSSDRTAASVATIYKVLAAYGQTISTEALSQVAFCGCRMILTRRKTTSGPGIIA